ncbi:hypothetical protein [Aureimonas sp. ME7]|uniref:hypothetical protein n=1 Tax=Aureimonas sp. ME7 TaxID=2744252 RepID=UPI0015F4201A|nr:hypothetical protein [Aureimonas sp. ME7]
MRWYESKAVWAAALALAGAVSGLLGFDLVGLESEDTVLAITAAGSAVGAAVIVLRSLRKVARAG